MSHAGDEAPDGGARSRASARRARGATDPLWVSCAVALMLVMAGFAFMGFAWRGVARTAFVPFQLPWIISGGIGGLCLVAAGATILSTQLSRREAARERRDLERLVELTGELMGSLRETEDH